MFEKTISKNTEDCLEKLNKISIIKNFYLAGGTALALQIGHRKSLDLDLFTKNEFSEISLLNNLKKQGNISLNKKEWQTIHCNFYKTKLSFINYPYPLLFKTKKYNNIKIADIRDIACMKLDAVSSRGSKKDFIDIYVITKEYYSLNNIIKLFKKKYKDIDYNILHILKSLSYFDEAEKEPMPFMFYKLSWKEVKQYFKDEIVKIKF